MIASSIGSATLEPSAPIANSGAAATAAPSGRIAVQLGAASGAAPHHGGHLMQALQEAFQSLGLSAPATVSAATTSSGSDNNGSGTSTSSTRVSGAIAPTSLQTALRNFVQALFSAVHSDHSVSTSSAPGGRFSAGLSAVITQVSNGNASSDLQSAFSSLVSDLQTRNASSSSSAAAPVTLQSLLTTLQQDLGYDDNNASAAAVSSVNAQA